MILIVLLLTLTTMFFDSINQLNANAILIFVMITLVNVGALLEQRKWIYYLECFRLISVFAYVFYVLNIFELLIFPVVGLIILERTFSLSSLYNKYILRYRNVKN